MNKDALILHLKEKKREYQQHIKDIDKMLKDLEKQKEALDSVEKDTQVFNTE